MERAEEIVHQDLLTELEFLDRMTALGMSYDNAAGTLKRLIKTRKVVVNRLGRLELAT